MTATISRLYNNYADAREAVRNLEAAGVAHNDINIIASNADNWYSSDRKPGQDTFPDRDLDGKDDRAEAAGAGAGVGAAVGGTSLPPPSYDFGFNPKVGARAAPHAVNPKTGEDARLDSLVPVLRIVDANVLSLCRVDARAPFS